MDSQPIDVVGAGFVPGWPGVYGNNTIPVEQEESAPVLPAQDAPQMLSSLSSEQVQPASQESAQKAQPSISPLSESNSDEDI
jgi:hypothetical protein